jgi:hypothetical protein
MLDLFPLPVFPQGSLASSVVTTVWVGVAVVAFFNLRLGWVLSGLVVPGYLVPLLIVKPWSAAVVIIEGIITYLIVWLFSERLSKLGYWFSFFGRDRFFALLLVSIAVRVSFDGWLWPAIGLWANEAYGLAFDYRNNLQSFGLIIIALIANQFWKTGLLRGVVPLVVTVGVTYLIVRYGLMEWTNFTISNVGYMYEDIASSILASPKAYIILIVAALVASRMNLLYGWDFSGILIPALLALQWYQPIKILASFAEALLILWVARAFLQLPVFRNANIEGARKLLLFFNIGFVYKVLLGYFVIWWFPEMKITDTYAFGYLLATLLAIKMHDKDIAARMTRATLQTSLAGIAIASLVGFMLTMLPLGPVADNRTEHSMATIVDRPDISLSQRLREDKVRFYASYRSQVPVPLTGEIESFRQTFGSLEQYRSGHDEALLKRAAADLNLLGFQIERLEDRYLYISEAGASRGWGVYVLNLNNPGGLLIEVPAPLDEQGTLEAGAELFRLLNAGVLAVASSRREANPDQSADVLRNPQTVYHQFHRVMASNNVLQIRAYTAQSARELEGQRSDTLHLAEKPLPCRLWIKSTIPPELDLPKLRDYTGEMQVEWGDSPFVNRQRETVRKGFAELLLNRAALRRIYAKSVLADVEPHVEVQDQRIDGYLQEWILSGKHLTASRGSDTYVVPTVDELLYFDEEILTPLLRLAVHGYGNSGWTDEGQEALRGVQAAAAVVGYHLMQYRHRHSEQEFIVLHEPETASRRRYWGTYVLRLGAADAYLIQVPRPLYEVNSFEYAVSLFERLNARALLIAGAHPDANRDGSADLVRQENMLSLFSLVNQVLLRESGDMPMMAIHSRARGYRAGVPAVVEDALLSARRALPVVVGKDALSAKFLDTLSNEGVSYRFVDGSPETAGYEVDGVVQSQYLAATTNKQFWAIWLSPLARSNYRQQTENRQEVARFNALGIETIEEDLYAYLVARPAAVSAAALVPDALREAIRRYLVSQDIVNLRSLQHNWSQFDFKRLVDRDSRQSFIVVHDEKARALLVANLNPRQPAIELAWHTQVADRLTVQDFINRRAGWLVTRQGS